MICELISKNKYFLVRGFGLWLAVGLAACLTGVSFWALGLVDRAWSAVLAGLVVLAAGWGFLLGKILWQTRRVADWLDALDSPGAKEAASALRAGVIRPFAAFLRKLVAQQASLEKELFAIRRDWQILLNQLAEGVLITDARGGIVAANQAFRAIFGTGEKLLEGALVHEVVRSAEFLQLLEAALGGQEVQPSQVKLPGADPRFLRVRVTGRSAETGKAGWIIIVEDLSTIRRLERLRRDFSANVSHELRTPITSIRGYAETLLDGAIHDPSNASKFLEIIVQQADRLLAIISDLMSLAEIERDEAEQKVSVTLGDLSKVVEAAVEWCRSQAEEKQIVIEVEIAQPLLAQINSRLLEQALVNLLDNAIKFSEPGTVVRVVGRWVFGEAILEVQDQGCGIENVHLPRIFERFYRVDKSRSRQLGGTGLGLAIVKHIAQAHGGRVSVDSQVGKGSVFRIHLPEPKIAETNPRMPDGDAR